jgi:hypothetical protein
LKANAKTFLAELVQEVLVQIKSAHNIPDSADSMANLRDCGHQKSLFFYFLVKFEEWSFRVFLLRKPTPVDENDRVVTIPKASVERGARIVILR